jgi:hypothetical protein
MSWDFANMTMGQMGDVMEAIARAPDPEAEERMQEFLAAYREFSPHADANLGYLTGYFGRDTANRMLELLEVEHPVFGAQMPTNPASAMIAGRMWGQAMKEGEV